MALYDVNNLTVSDAWGQKNPKTKMKPLMKLKAYFFRGGGGWAFPQVCSLLQGFDSICLLVLGAFWSSISS